MSTFRGIWVALATPFRAGEIDFAALRGLVGRLLEDGVAGFVVCGTTGEAAALSHEEQLAVLDAVLQWVPPQQVIMGLAGNNLRELLARHRLYLQLNRQLVGNDLCVARQLRYLHHASRYSGASRRDCLGSHAHGARHSDLHAA